MFLANILEAWIEFWRFFLDFGLFMAIEDLKKPLDFSTFHFFDNMFLAM
jgi:hypothetical protein